MLKTETIILMATLLLGGCSAKQNQKLEDSAKSAQNVTEKMATNMENDALALKIKATMMASSQLDSSAIKVSKDGKIYSLQGYVKSDAQKSLAERIARDTMGKDEPLVNALSVGPPPSPAPSPRSTRESGIPEPTKSVRPNL
jgi:osmotically-inducible protein OsmY